MPNGKQRDVGMDVSIVPCIALPWCSASAECAEDASNGAIVAAGTATIAVVAGAGGGVAVLRCGVADGGRSPTGSGTGWGGA